MFRKRLSAGEVIGYAIFLTGFILLVARGGFRDVWLEVALGLMLAGAIVAGRASGK